MNKEVILKQYEELKRNRYVIEEIEPDFFFEIVDCLLKENEELKDLIIHKNEYTKKLEEDLFENCSNYVISKQKVKDKIEELENIKLCGGAVLEAITEEKIRMLKELSESGE